MSASVAELAREIVMLVEDNMPIAVADEVRTRIEDLLANALPKEACTAASSERGPWERCATCGHYALDCDIVLRGHRAAPDEKSAAPKGDRT